MNHLNQFTDAGPLQEGCDMLTCTDRVGGEHSDKCEVSQYRCFLCRRDTWDGLYRLVDYGLHVERVCDLCWEKGDEGIDAPLDYTEDDFNIEGQPEFNGAFGRGGRDG